MKKFILFSFVLIFSSTIIKADFSTQWTTSVGGLMTDMMYDSYVDADGYIYVSGMADGSGSWQNYGGYVCGTVKINPDGSVAWFKKFDISGQDPTNEIGFAVTTDNDGNVIVGVTSARNAAQNCTGHIIKYDASGNLIWAVELNTGSDWEMINGIETDENDNIYLGGKQDSMSFVAKVNPSGVTLWSTFVNTWEVHELKYKNGSIYAAGLGVYKLNTSGNILWGPVGGVGVGDFGNSLFVDNDNNVYATGSKGIPSQFNTVKINTNGTIEWSNLLPSIGGFKYGYAVTTDPSGNVYSTGLLSSKTIVVKYSPAGNVLWADSSDLGSGRGLVYKDGFLYVAGTYGAAQGGNYGLKQFNASTGEYLNQVTSPGGRAYDAEISGGNIIVAGYSQGNYHVISITPTSVGINPISTEIPGSFALKQNYPNPFNPSTKIAFDIPVSGFAQLTVYDASGRMVSTLVNAQLSAGRYEASFNASGLTSGIYFYTLQLGEFTQTKKMLLIK